jgi:excisionase family DNA binding protein
MSSTVVKLSDRRKVSDDPDDEIFTLEEATVFLKVKKRTIYNLVELRRIPFLKVGRLLRFSRAALMKWMQEEADRQA